MGLAVLLWLNWHLTLITIFVLALFGGGMADRIYKAAPSAGGKRVGEGSILGGLGGLLDGDND